MKLTSSTTKRIRSANLMILNSRILMMMLVSHVQNARMVSTLIMKMFCWPIMRRDNKRNCRTYDTCLRVKRPTTKAPVSLILHPKHQDPGKIYTTLPPDVNGNDTIVTLVDMFTEQAHFVPCSFHIDAPQLAK
eukprot:scaffold678599_cov57-Prasinocladus_malaysianus.AAC.1